jgi:hypothetical protein
MSIIHPHFYFPSDQLPIGLNLWWRDNCDLFLRCLTQAKYHRPWGNSNTSGNLLIYPPECHTKEINLNGRKPKHNGTKLGNSNAQSTTFRWLNIPLTSEDIDLLEREEVTLEQLAFSYISLGMFGLGLSVKYDNARKSYSVSIYRPSDATHLQPVGISGSSSDLRDALLVSLYRFNHCLEGSFDNAPDSDAVIQPRRFY